MINNGYVKTIQALVRPFIAFVLIVTTVFLFMIGKINPHEILNLTSLVIGFYFGERAALKVPNGREPKVE